MPIENAGAGDVVDPGAEAQPNAYQELAAEAKPLNVSPTEAGYSEARQQEISDLRNSIIAEGGSAEAMQQLQSAQRQAALEKQEAAKQDAPAAIDFKEAA